MKLAEAILRLLWSRAKGNSQGPPDSDDRELITLGQARRLTSGVPVGLLLESATPPCSYRPAE
jgi:hypothetical protein